MSRVLYNDPHVTIRLDDGLRLVRYTRSREPYPSIESVRELNKALRVAFELLPPGTLSLLIDAREAPPRNDEAFEGEVNRAIQAVVPRFAAYAILVRTAVGLLQVKRVAKARGEDAHVFTDEAEALAFLRARPP